MFEEMTVICFAFRSKEDLSFTYEIAKNEENEFLVFLVKRDDAVRLEKSKLLSSHLSLENAISSCKNVERKDFSFIK